MIPSAFKRLSKSILKPAWVEIVSATVNDFGVLVNPMLVAGQAHGGIAQGAGQALMESVVYDEEDGDADRITAGLPGCYERAIFLVSALKNHRCRRAQSAQLRQRVAGSGMRRLRCRR